MHCTLSIIVKHSIFVIYPVSAQTDNNSSNNVPNNKDNATMNTMDLAMSALARIHLIAANEAEVSLKIPFGELRKYKV
jgi:hypothetical protein